MAASVANCRSKGLGAMLGGGAKMGFAKVTMGAGWRCPTRRQAAGHGGQRTELMAREPPQEASRATENP